METLLQYGIWGCFFALILTPFGLPIPEEISLLTAGALVGNGHSDFWIGWILGFLGVTLGDVIAWTFGRTLGLEPTGFVSKLIGSKQIDDIEKFYRRFGDWTIVIARQIPGMRFPAFFFAGASAIPLGRFYLIDGLAALITVNVFYGLGIYFADDIKSIQEGINSFVDYAGLTSTIILVALVSFVVYRRVRHRKNAK